MSQEQEWGVIHYAVAALGVLWGVVCTFAAVIWTDLKSKIKELTSHVGKHFSDINNLKVDVERIETRVGSHSEKLDDIAKTTRRIEDKQDALLREVMERK